jgi:hypothetical protein
MGGTSCSVLVAASVEVPDDSNVLLGTATEDTIVLTCRETVSDWLMVTEWVQECNLPAQLPTQGQGQM